MAAPSQSHVNRIADAVVMALREVSSKKDSTKWLTAPRTVKRSFMLGDLTMAERPGMYVRVLSWRDSTMMGGGRRETILTVGVTCLVDDKEGAEPALNDLIRDAIRAVAEDEQLKSASGLVISIYPLSYELEVEAMNKCGLGVGTLTLEALFAWDKSAP